MSFADDILQEAAGEAIEAIVIGPPEWSWRETKRDESIQTGVVLTWEQARPMLDYEYSAGYGLPECHPVWAWTATRVIFVVQYDGSTSLWSVPRHPSDGLPEMPGG